MRLRGVETSHEAACIGRKSMPPHLTVGEVLPYVQGASLKGSAVVFVRLSNSPTTSGAGGRCRFGGVRVEPSYSVWADWLSKFHTWPEGVQALWIIGLTATALGLIAGTTRVLVAIAGIFLQRERPGGGRWRSGDAGALFLEREPAPKALTDRSAERRGWPDQVRP